MGSWPIWLLAFRNALAIAALLAVAAGCSRVDRHWGTPGEVRIAIHVDPHTLIAMFAIDQRQIDITQIYAQPLVGIGPDNKPYPLLCTQIPNVANGGISHDARTITYHLRRGIRFADGVEFTSADVAFTYRVILDPRNPTVQTAAYRRIARLDTPDRHTVVMHLRAPWVNAPQALFAEADYVYGIMPAHAFNGNTEVTRSAWAQHPFGTGPFRVTSWKRGDSIVFEPNPYSWQHPRLKRIVMKIVADSNAGFVGLQNHSFDMVELSEPQVARARALPAVSVIQIPRNETEFAKFNAQSDAMRDPAVRAAISQAIDRVQIARTAYYGLSPMATTEVPAVFDEHDSAVTPIAFNPNAAKAYFVRHPLPHALRIIVDNSTIADRTAATIMQSQLLAAGIAADLRAYPSDMIYAPAPEGPYYGGRFDIEMGGWYGGLNAEQSEFFRCDFIPPNGPNTARFCDPRYDAALDRQAVSTDAAVRRAAYRTMQETIAASHVLVPFVYLNEYLGVNANLHDVKPDMLYNFGNIAEWQMR